MDSDRTPCILCKSLVHDCDELEEGTPTISKSQLDQIRNLLTITDLSTWPELFSIILGELGFYYTLPAILIVDAYRKLMVKYPCHICHEDILMALLTVVNVKYLNNLTHRFVRQVMRNTYFNRQLMNTEIVALSCEIVAKYIPADPEQLRMPDGDYIFLEIFEALIAQYGSDWSRRDDKIVHSILYRALTFYKSITFVEHDGLRNDCPNSLRNYCPDERVQMGLVKAFEFDPHLVSTIACNIIQSMVGHQAYIGKALKFYDSFTQMLFDEKAWNKSTFFAASYLELIATLSKALFRKFPWFREDIKIHSRYKQNMKTLLVAASELGAFETLDLYDIIIYGVLDVVHELNLVDDLFKLFYRKIQGILRDAKDELDHNAKPSKPESSLVKYKYKNAPDIVQARKYGDNSAEWIETIFKTIEKLIRNDISVVIRFDLDFLQALITVGRSDKMYYSGSYVVELMRYILKRRIASKLDVLNTDIVQAIFDVINGFHNNCIFCAHGLDTSETLLDLLGPTPREVSDWAENCTVKLAMTLPYVLRTKERLYEVMYPKGFKLLTEQLQYDENIESLYMVAQTLTKKPPVVHTLATAAGWNDTPSDDTHRTKIFVLDDGTRICADITRLVKYSRFFASLFDGRFHEATLDEIHIHDATEYQFNFMVRYIHCEASEQKMTFNLDVNKHLDLIIFFDRLSMLRMLRHMIDSLRWSCLTIDELSQVYEVGLMYGIDGVRNACVDFVLASDSAMGGLKINMLKSFVAQTTDKKQLGEDVNRWISLKCEHKLSLLDQ